VRMEINEPGTYPTALGVDLLSATRRVNVRRDVTDLTIINEDVDYFTRGLAYNKAVT
jgi:hypothetical protein